MISIKSLAATAIPCVALAIGICSCARKATSFILNKEKTQASIHRGDSIVIKLEGDFGSGYSWIQYDSCSTLIKLVDKTFSTQREGPDGQVFRFKAQKTGDCTMTFLYKRAFEENTSPRDSIIFNFKIL